MTDSDALDRYFTSQVIGETLVVTMGASASVRPTPSHGVSVDWQDGRAETFGRVARSLWSDRPLAELAGRPFSLEAVLALRRRGIAVAWASAAVAFLAAWSLMLWWLFSWLQRP